MKNVKVIKKAAMVFFGRRIARLEVRTVSQ